MYSENIQPALVISHSMRPPATPARRFPDQLANTQRIMPPLGTSPLLNNQQSSPSPEVLIQPLFIDKMANEMGLSNDLRINLHTFVQLGTRDATMSKADLMTRLFTLAAIFQNTAERRRHEATNSITGITELMNDLKIRLEDTFHLSKEQNDNVRVIAQDMICQTSRVTFKTLHLDVIKEISEHRKETGFTNIFNNPAREKVLLIRAKHITSSVRNAFRQDLRASVFGDAKCSLEEFTLEIAGKYKRLSIGEAVTQADLVHNVLLRSFAIDHPGLLNVDENEGTDDETIEDARPSKKKRKRGGRVPKEQDFWLQVDQYFAKQVEINGRNLTTSTKWKEVIDTAMLRERQRLDPAEDRAASVQQQQLPSTQPSSPRPFMWEQHEEELAETSSQPSFQNLDASSQGYQWIERGQQSQYSPYDRSPMAVSHMLNTAPGL